MFTYPFRAGVIGWLAGLSLVMIVVQGFTGALRLRWLPRFEVSPDSSAVAFGLVGILMEVFWWLMAFKLAVEGMRTAASGKGEDGPDIWIEDEQAGRQAFLWGATLLVGYLLYANLGTPALALYCLLLAVLMPAIVFLLGMEDSLRRAFDPGAWRALLQHSGAQYPMVAAKLALLAALYGLTYVKFFALQPRWLGVPLSRLVLLYLMVAGFYELGRALAGHRRAPGKAKATPVAPAEVVVSEDEALWLRAADRYAGDGRFAKAAQQLEALITTPEASATAHARYRELLGRAGDDAGLLWHARFYVPALLRCGEEREALALYQDSRDGDPEFEVQDPATLSALIGLAMREQFPQLAINLAQEYLRRFADEPDAVSNSLAAARLMDRMGRDEEARLLLVELVRRYRDHPMRGEVIAALETLESVARRNR